MSVDRDRQRRKIKREKKKVYDAIDRARFLYHLPKVILLSTALFANNFRGAVSECDTPIEDNIKIDIAGPAKQTFSVFISGGA